VPVEIIGSSVSKDTGMVVDILGLPVNFYPKRIIPLPVFLEMLQCRGMKKDTHPDNYREVIFLDNTSGEEFLLFSTVETDETGTYKKKEYPLYRVEISSASHPFYTGVKTTIDTAGRVEKFKTRAKAASSK